MHAVGAAAQLAGRLRAAEEQQAEDGGLVAAEVEDGAYAVLVARGSTGVAGGGDEFEVLQLVEGSADLVFGEAHDGIAAGSLVACIDQRVK